MFAAVQICTVTLPDSSDLNAVMPQPKSEPNAKVDLGLLEEDDEFEEFPAEGEWCGGV